MWNITNGVLTNPGTTPGIPAEGPVGQSVLTSGLADGLDKVIVSFDYSVGAGSTLYFHLLGFTTNGTPSTDEQLANTQPQNGSIQNQAETDFGDMNILNGGDPNGSAGNAVSFAATSGTYTATFSLTNYTWSADESPGLTGDIAEVKDFDLILAAFASNVTSNDGAGAISISNITISAKTSAETSVSVSPDDELLMVLLPGETIVTGSLDVAYISATNVDIAVSISDESHAGSFSVLSATPQTLTGPATLEIEYDNTTPGLTDGAAATCLVTVAWNEEGLPTTNNIVVPVRAQTGYAANANNGFIGAGNGISWGDPDNWSLDRVPGTLGADRALIQIGGIVCNVDTNFTGPFGYNVWIRVASGVSPVLNIGADLKNANQIHVGQATGQYGTLNHTAGAVEVATLTVAHATGTATNNSAYTQTGGSVDVDSLTVNPTGELNLNGGTMDIATSISILSNGVINVDGGALTFDVEPANRTVNYGEGLLRVKSGSFTTLAAAASDVLTYQAQLEVSGGTVTLNGQNKLAKLTVIGDDASISINAYNRRPSSARSLVEFELGSNGVSTVNLTGWAHLDMTDIVVDGSSYTGGGTNITLFKGGDFQNLSTNVVVQNFAGDYAASVTQSLDTDTVELIITVGGPDISLDMPSGGPVTISWPVENGSAYNVMTNVDLVNGTWGDAEWTPFLDGDVYKATNSIGSEPRLFYRLENK